MLSENIKALRCEKGFSQEELAQHLNIVRQTVSKWEQGLSVPDSDMLVQLAAVLDTTVSQLLDAESPAGAPEIPTAVPNKKSKVVNTVLIVAGAPLWLPLGIAALAVILSVYVSLWAVIVSLWAAFGALCASSLGGLASGIALSCTGDILVGLAIVGCALICAGLAIFLFFGCRAATRGSIWLTKWLAQCCKRFFAKKEVA